MFPLMERGITADKFVKWAGAKLMVREAGGNFREVTKQDGHEELRIISWNINSLIRKLSDEDFLSELNSYDIVLLSETWISSKYQCHLEIDGFNSIHMYGQKSYGVKRGRQSGGLSIYSKQELKPKKCVMG